MCAWLVVCCLCGAVGVAACRKRCLRANAQWTDIANMQDARASKSGANANADSRGLGNAAPRARVGVEAAPTLPTLPTSPTVVGSMHPGDDDSSDNSCDDSPPRPPPAAPVAPPTIMINQMVKTTSRTRSSSNGSSHAAATPALSRSCSSTATAAAVDATSETKNGPSVDASSLTQHHAEQWRATQQHLRDMSPALRGRSGATGSMLTGVQREMEGTPTGTPTTTPTGTPTTPTALKKADAPAQPRPSASQPLGAEPGERSQSGGVPSPAAKGAAPEPTDEENTAVQQIASPSRPSMPAPSLPRPSHRFAPLRGSTPSTSVLLPPIKRAADIEATTADKDASALALERERLKEELAELRRPQ